MKHALAAGIVAAVLVAGCSSSSANTTSNGTAASNPATTPTAQPTATPQPTPTPTPEPTGPKTFAVGYGVTVQSSGVDEVRIKISDVSIHKTYGSGYLVDKPRQAGNVFIQAKVTYESLKDGASYNQFDWQVFCAGQAIDNWAFVTAGPQPDLGSGTLPKGRTASGWVVYEVPAAGEVRMSYKGNMFLDDAPVFEVVIRQ